MDSPARSTPAPLYSVSQFTTPRNTFAQDVEQLVQSGAAGIGVCESKLPDGGDGEALELLARSGLRATLCTPRVWTILPSRLSPEPADPARRLDLICSSIRRLAPFQPAAYLVTAGALGDFTRPRALELLTSHLAAIARAAAEVGGTVGLEPIRLGSASPDALINTLAESVEILGAVGQPNLGVVFDIWHLWDEPGVHDLILRHVDRIVGVQVNDWREPTRSWCDRALPGEGRADVPSLLASFLRAGYRGWYDLEIFSDDGRFGNAYPDSLWAIPHEELLRRARRAFDRAWSVALDQLQQQR